MLVSSVGMLLPSMPTNSHTRPTVSRCIPPTAISPPRVHFPAAIDITINYMQTLECMNAAHSLWCPLCPSRSIAHNGPVHAKAISPQACGDLRTTKERKLTMLAAVSTFEREIMLERQRKGIHAAKFEGRIKDVRLQHRHKLSRFKNYYIKR